MNVVAPAAPFGALSSVARRPPMSTAARAQPARGLAVAVPNHKERASATRRQLGTLRHIRARILDSAQVCGRKTGAGSRHSTLKAGASKSFLDNWPRAAAPGAALGFPPLCPRMTPAGPA